MIYLETLKSFNTQYQHNQGVYINAWKINVSTAVYGKGRSMRMPFFGGWLVEGGTGEIFMRGRRGGKGHIPRAKYWKVRHDQTMLF